MVKRRRIAILQLIPIFLLRAPLSASQELFDRYATLVMVNNPELGIDLRNRTTISAVVPDQS